MKFLQLISSMDGGPSVVLNLVCKGNFTCVLFVSVLMNSVWVLHEKTEVLTGYAGSVRYL